MALGLRKSRYDKLAYAIAGFALVALVVNYFITMNRVAPRPEEKPIPSAIPIDTRLAYPEGFYDSPADISKALDGFHTNSGRSAIEALNNIGLQVTRVTVESMASLETSSQQADPSSSSSDVDYVLDVKGKLKDGLPCDMSSYMRTGQATLEFVRTKDNFPQLDESSQTPTDGLVFWIASGKCSKAY